MARLLQRGDSANPHVASAGEKAADKRRVARSQRRRQRQRLRQRRRKRRQRGARRERSRRQTRAARKGPQKPPPELPTDHRAVALIPAQRQNVGMETALRIQQRLIEAIDAQSGVLAVAPQDVRTEVSAVNLSPDDCGRDVPCLARVARYARAHRAIVFQLAYLGGTLSIAMRLIDAVDKREIRRVGESLADDLDKRARQLDALAVQLLSPETYVGSLSVTTEVPGAAIYLDAEFIGKTPLEGRIKELRAGPHILRVSKPGFKTLYQFVDVAYQRHVKVKVDLAANTISGKIVEEVSEAGYGALFVDSTLSGIQLRIDGEPRATTPLETPLAKLAPGKRRLAFYRDGKPLLRETVEVKKDNRTDLALTLGPEDQPQVEVLQTVSLDSPLPGSAPPEMKAPSTQKPASKPMGWVMTTAWVSGGAAAAGAAAAFVMGALVNQQQQRADQLARDYGRAPLFPEQRRALEAELAQAQSQAQRFEQAQWASLGTAAGLAAVGASLFLWDWFSGPARSESDASSPPKNAAGAAGLQPIVELGAQRQRLNVGLRLAF